MRSKAIKTVSLFQSQGNIKMRNNLKYQIGAVINVTY